MTFATFVTTAITSSGSPRKAVTFVAIPPSSTRSAPAAPSSGKQNGPKLFAPAREGLRRGRAGRSTVSHTSTGALGASRSSSVVGRKTIYTSRSAPSERREAYMATSAAARIQRAYDELVDRGAGEAGVAEALAVYEGAEQAEMRSSGAYPYAVTVAASTNSSIPARR